MTAERTSYNLPYAFTEGYELYVLNDTFSHVDGFRGVTGTVLYPVSQEEYDESVSVDGLAEYYEEAWRVDAGSRNGTELELEDWVEKDLNELIKDRYEKYDVSNIDLSFIKLDFEPVIWEVIGGGRCFPMPTEALYVPDNYSELTDLINKFEK